MPVEREKIEQILERNRETAGELADEIDGFLSKERDYAPTDLLRRAVTALRSAPAQAGADAIRAAYDRVWKDADACVLPRQVGVDAVNMAIEACAKAAAAHSPQDWSVEGMRAGITSAILALI
jgi:hypothetical protein